MQKADFKTNDVVVFNGVICFFSTIKPLLDEKDLEKVKLASLEDIKKHKECK